MEIILAKQAGFCFGVKRATQMAFEAADKGEETFTLGPIIHSPQVVQKLDEMGVKVLEDLADLDTGTIIIRSTELPRRNFPKQFARNWKLSMQPAHLLKKPRNM